MKRPINTEKQYQQALERAEYLMQKERSIELVIAAELKTLRTQIEKYQSKLLEPDEGNREAPARLGRPKTKYPENYTEIPVAPNRPPFNVA